MRKKLSLLCGLLLPLAVLASCSEAPEMVAPDVTPQFTVSSDTDDVPDELDAVARYIGGSSPQAQVEYKWIGPAGGSLRLGDFETIVPPGAVLKKTRFSIRIMPESNPRKHALASFSPHQTFNRAVTIRVPLRGTESAGATNVNVLWWNGKKWVSMPSHVTNDGRIETQTTHFSVYGTQKRGFTLAGG